MKTFRAKLAALLAATIVAMVGLITFAMIHTFRPSTDDAVEVFASQLITMVRLAEQASVPTVLSAQPADGSIDRHQTELYKAVVSRLGAEFDLLVTSKQSATNDRLRSLSLRVGPDRWLITELLVRDPSPWIIRGWLALITLAVGTVSLIAANRMSRPLALLEKAVASVSHDAILPMLPEHGPAEVKATAKVLNSLSTRLQRAVESRMRLVAAAGHDLRTPLTRMRLRAEFISDAEERELWLKDIEELGHIADSAIQLVREETEMAPPATIRVDDLVRFVVDELQKQGYSIAVTNTDAVCVLAGELALRRALRNLLINAATHGVRGQVRVTGGRVARIIVTDDGPGIPEALMDRVFEPFFRADRARSQQIPGVGLGLSISWEIIRRAGGEISIENRPSGGLVQIVSLPSASEANARLDILTD